LCTQVQAAVKRLNAELRDEAAQLEKRLQTLDESRPPNSSRAAFDEGAGVAARGDPLVALWIEERRIVDDRSSRRPNLCFDAAASLIGCGVSYGRELSAQ
jgi:hypothetical protein